MGDTFPLYLWTLDRSWTWHINSNSRFSYVYTHYFDVKSLCQSNRICLKVDETQHDMKQMIQMM